jgi:hypothetical protein
MPNKPKYSDLPAGAVVFDDLPQGASVVAQPSQSIEDMAAGAAGAAPGWKPRGPQNQSVDMQPATGLSTGAWRTAKRVGSNLSGMVDAIGPGKAQTPQEMGDIGDAFARDLGSKGMIGEGALNSALPGLGLGTQVRGYAHTAKTDPVGAASDVVGDAATLAALYGVGKAVPKVADAIPSTKRAGQTLESVMQDAKDVPVKLTRTMDPLERSQQLASRGAPSWRTADQLYQRANQTTPITYGEGRDFYSNITNQSVADKMGLNGPMSRVAGDLREAFKGDLQDAASVVGRGEDYARAMKEYARAMRWKDALGKAGKYGAITAGAGGAVSGAKKLLDIFGR